MSFLPLMEGKQFCSFIKKQTRQYQVNTCIHVMLLLLLIGEMVQAGINQSLSKERVKRVLATDGSTDPIEGPCVFFLRPNIRKAVTTANVTDVS